MTHCTFTISNQHFALDTFLRMMKGGQKRKIEVQTKIFITTRKVIAQDFNKIQHIMFTASF